ncbi:hypothetical protein OPV22_006184 [Ensete ventricosum]|uniref:RING-type domain-containing protein n=1 Tax=Ensete ventricosum TaxID=4639 RepID=A0AAV8RP67_ENSVE|nr:hypothetical protein OPV22_006184 [Ensete ventricosum]
MSFPLVCCCMVVPQPVVQLLKTLDQIRSFILMIIVYLGVYQQDQHIASATGRPPRQATPSSIKARLPVVEFGSLVDGRPRGWCCAEEPMCVFCLDRLEQKDEVRKLGNCRHAFHRGCIDRWVDKGEFSCPVCRSELLPKGGGGMKGSILKFICGLVRRHGVEDDN